MDMLHYSLQSYMRINRLKYILLIAFYWTLNLHATPTLSSDLPIVYDTKNKCSIAEGNAEFINKDLRLQSDCIYYFSENAKALAKGNLRITNASLRLLGNEGGYWISDKRLELDSFRLEVKGHGVQGRNLQGPLDCLKAEDLCIDYNGVQDDIAGVHIKAKKGVLHGHDYFELYDAVFHIGKLPVFYTPYFHHNFEESTLRWKSDCGLVRRDKEYGRYIRNDLFVNFGWRIKPGIMFDYYRKRDFLVGGMFEYNEPSAQGVFKVARIHDSDLEVHKVSNPKLENARYFSEWRHSGSINDKTDIAVQMEWMRDKDFLEDFRPDENNGTRQHPDNFAEISHRTDNSVTSFITRYRFNHFQHIQERLPELRWDYLPVRLDNTPLYYQYGLGISHLREKPLDLTRDVEKELRRADAFFGVTVPLDLCSWATFTPVAGARVIQYWGLNKSPQHHDYTRWLGQVGFVLRFRSYGDYTYENEYWNIHDFRHIIQPVIQYRYLPNGHQGNKAIPAIDREGLEGKKPSLQSIDLLGRRDIDDLNDMHLLRFGLENFLYTNFKDGQTKQWMHFNIYQDVRLQRSKENGVQQKTLSDTFIDFEWTPASFFSFNQYLRLDPTEKRLRESNTSISLAEGDLWRLSCSHSYTQDGGAPTNQNSLTFSYRLNSTNVLSASISVDAHKPDLIKQTYTWSTVVAKTWNLDVIFEWKKRQRPIVSSKDSWNIRFILTFVEW